MKAPCSRTRSDTEKTESTFLQDYAPRLCSDIEKREALCSKTMPQDYAPRLRPETTPQDYAQDHAPARLRPKTTPQDHAPTRLCPKATPKTTLQLDYAPRLRPKTAHAFNTILSSGVSLRRQLATDLRAKFKPATRNVTTTEPQPQQATIIIITA